jgi:hypothetical protein
MIEKRPAEIADMLEALLNSLMDIHIAPITLVILRVQRRRNSRKMSSGHAKSTCHLTVHIANVICKRKMNPSSKSYTMLHCATGVIVLPQSNFPVIDSKLKL